MKKKLKRTFCKDKMRQQPTNNGIFLKWYAYYERERAMLAKCFLVVYVYAACTPQQKHCQITFKPLSKSPLNFM